ncbi:hypothetical protein [Parafrankia sp. EAN1pec]|uniref:hypothetical protein n=1 Tax=Parafrankia sp. (strain EAN1pec) TaxID=298653 RepID=UPI0026B46232
MIATAALRAETAARVEGQIAAAGRRAAARRAADRTKRRRRDAGLVARHNRKEARIRAGLETR